MMSISTSLSNDAAHLRSCESGAGCPGTISRYQRKRSLEDPLSERAPVPGQQLGLSLSELEVMIGKRMTELDDAQEDQEHLGPFADLLRTATMIAFHRAAELIDANNRRLAEQLEHMGWSGSGR
jgi:hypothetical protein